MAERPDRREGAAQGDAAAHARGAEDGGQPREGLLLDWGGVMTGNLFASFGAFCEEQGLDPKALGLAFRQDEQARSLLFAFEEGRATESDFEAGLARALGIAAPSGLIDRLFQGASPDPAMVEAVKAIRAAGVRTGLISNSWGTTRYPRQLLSQLFDGIVISGEVGIRKPAPEIYRLGAEAIGLPPQSCVFVDDLPFNLPPAQELGMAVIHHLSASETIAQMGRLLGVPSLA